MKKLLFFIMIAVCLPNLSYSQDTMGNRLSAAEQYADTFDFEKMIKDSTVQMSLNLPEKERDSFVKEMMAQDLSWMRSLAITSMVQIFSVEELNALADFYGSPVGRSIMKKFPVYAASIMPVMQKRLSEGAEKVLSK